MYKKIITLVIIGFSIFSFSQNKVDKISDSNTLFLVDGFISSKQFLIEKGDKLIKKMNVYNSSEKFPKNYQNIISDTTIKSLVDVTFKEMSYDIISLAELNAQSNLPENNPVIFGGYEFKNTSAKILGDVLYSIKKVNKDGREYLEINSTEKK